MQEEVIKIPDEVFRNVARHFAQSVDELFVFHPEWFDPEWKDEIFDGNPDSCGWHKLGKSCPVHDEE